jgi:hypothetical protein
MPTRSFGRVIAAACLIVAAAAFTVSSLVTPMGSGKPDRTAVGRFAAHPGRVDVLLAADVFVVVFGAAVVLAALLARPGSPRLAAVAGWLGIVTSSALVMLVGIDFATAAAVHVDRQSGGDLVGKMTDSPGFAVFVVLGLLGGAAAMVCLGIALWRSKAVPGWAAVAVALAEPANFVAGGSGVIAGAVGGALLLPGFGACALRILRGGVPDPVGTVTMSPVVAPAPVAAT